MVSAPLTALQPGMNSPAVKQLQDWLVSQGFMTEAQVNTGPGIYGPQTKAAVTAWQIANGVDNSTGPGYWGPKTIAAASKVATEEKKVTEKNNNNYTTNNTDKTVIENKVDPNARIIFPAGEKYAFVRADNDPSGIYLVDSVNKTIQKFQSTSAIAANPFFGTTYEDLVNNGEIQTISFNDLINNQGFIASGTIQSDGTDPDFNKKVSNWDTVTTYGKKINQNDSGIVIDLVKNIYKTAVSSGIATQATVDSALANNTFVKHFSALAAGGYSVEDVMKDLKRLDLISKGDTSLSNVQVISPSISKMDYTKTAEGTKALTTSSINIPSTIGGLNSEEMKLPIAQLSSDTFKMLVPLMDPESQEFKDAMEKVNTLFLDHTQHLLDATTEQEHQVAQTQWLRDKAEIERMFKINLSDDVNSAWDQVSTMSKNVSAAGLTGSGLAREDQDKLMASLAETERRRRETRDLNIEDKNFQYAVNKATPEENANLTDEQKEKYGLKPSQDVIDFYTMENLKKLAPTASTSYLQAIIDAVIDKSSGSPMYQSSAYRQTAINSLNNLTNKEMAQSAIVLQENANKQADAAKKLGFDEGTFDKAATINNSSSGSDTTTPGQTQTPAPIPAPTQTQEMFYGYNPTTKTWGTIPKTPENVSATNTQLPILKAQETSSLNNTNSYNNTAANAAKKAAEDKAKADAAAKAAEAAKKISSGSTGTSGSTSGTINSSTPSSAYSGSSLVDYLKSSKQSSSYSDRAKLAASKGISNYTGTASQNTQLLKALRGY